MDDTHNLKAVPSPSFVIYESKIKENLSLLKSIEQWAGVQIIMAFKSNALWKLFYLLKEREFGFAASSLNELTLGFEELGVLGHTYCLAYKAKEFNQFLSMSSHITFNSLNQWHEHKRALEEWNSSETRHHVSPGLRVNPHCSVVETDLYNPALPGSRFGVNPDDLKNLPQGIEGLHFHQLCESDSHDLEIVIESFEKQFGHLVDDLKWLNMGGGHLITRADYDRSYLVKILKEYKSLHPNLEIILEPGSAFMWQTGDLVTTVMDVVEDAGVTTAIIDASFTCHMPDTLEMPYRPVIEGQLPDDADDGYLYNLGGNSCLSGDFKGPWRLPEKLKAGDGIILKDMNHYTTVKTTMFNGLQHPSMVLVRDNGEIEVLRRFDYNDFKTRMA